MMWSKIELGILAASSLVYAANCDTLLIICCLICSFLPGFISLDPSFHILYISIKLRKKNYRKSLFAFVTAEKLTLTSLFFLWKYNIIPLFDVRRSLQRKCVRESKKWKTVKSERQWRRRAEWRVRYSKSERQSEEWFEREWCQFFSLSKVF
jgi:hypothetical protein